MLDVCNSLILASKVMLFGIKIKKREELMKGASIEAAKSLLTLCTAFKENHRYNASHTPLSKTDK